MSTGKRLAKRSIIGTRVCAPGEDGLFYSGVIQSVKTTAEQSVGTGTGTANANANSNSNDYAEPNVDTQYSVRFDLAFASKKCPAVKRDFYGSQIIGPGFQPLSNFRLLPGQKVYLTYNGREISGHIVRHNTLADEVTVSINPPGHEGVIELKKRLEEIRLLESRKSARLMDQDTDFARLADMAADRKRTSTIEVPVAGSRKRRTSNSQDDFKEDHMNECTAALVLMSLSCSPNSSLNGSNWIDQPLSPSASFSDCASWRSGTPSPPLSESGNSGIWGSVGTDEGIVLDEDYYDEHPRKRKMNRTLFQCTWPGCVVITTTCDSIEAHVRTAHLGPRGEVSTSDNGYGEDVDFDDHEEEFYYTEIELEEAYSPPTLSHRDMARPPHEDPEYQKSLLNSSLPYSRRFASAGPINIPKNTNANMPWSFSATNVPISAASPVKHLKLSLSAPASKLPSSPTRRVRGETKKCRKVYGMEHRDQWCTQCKWKKACSRFGD